jgi:hypothetical protein
VSYDGMVGKTCDSRDGGWMQGAYCRESREGKGNKDQVRVAFFVCCCSLVFDLHREGEFRGGTTARRGSGKFLFTTVAF